MLKSKILIDTGMDAKPGFHTGEVGWNVRQDTVVYRMPIRDGVETRDGAGLRQASGTFQRGILLMPPAGTEIQHLPVAALEFVQGGLQTGNGIVCKHDVVFEDQDVGESLAAGFLHYGAMRQSAADVMIRLGADGFEAAHAMGNAQAGKARGDFLPAARLLREVDAVDGVEEMEGIVQFATNPGQDPIRSVAAEVDAEVFDRGGRIDRQFLRDDEIVAYAVFPGIGVGNTGGTREAMNPPQERQAQRPSTGAAEFFLNVPFLASEALQARIEAGPGGAPAGEDSKTLHRDIERRGGGILSTVVSGPDAVHASRPDWIHVSGNALQVVVDERAL